VTTHRNHLFFYIREQDSLSS